MCRSAQNDGWLRCSDQPDPRPDPNPNPNPNPTLWEARGLLSRLGGAVLSLRANLNTLHVRVTERLVHNLWPHNNKLYMPPQISKHYQVPFGNDTNFVNHPGAADTKIQPKSPKILLDMRYFCNFSLVSLGIRPRSRRCAEGTHTAGREA